MQPSAEEVCEKLLKLAPHSSSAITVGSGPPQGFMMSPLLHSHETPIHSFTITKSASRLEWSVITKDISLRGQDWTFWLNIKKTTQTMLETEGRWLGPTRAHAFQTKRNLPGTTVQCSGCSDPDRKALQKIIREGREKHKMGFHSQGYG